MNEVSTAPVETAAAPTQEAQPSAPEPRKIKVKVDGQEQELPEDEIAKDYQKYKSANKRYEEAAKLRSETAKEKAEVAALKKAYDEGDVETLFKTYGSEKARELSEKLLLKALNEAMISPEQREQMERDEKLRQYEERDEKEKLTKEEQAFQADVEKEQNYYGDFIADIMKETNLSKDPYTVRSVATYIKSCLKQGFEPTGEEVREAVEGRVKNDYKAQVSGRKGKELIDWLGEEVVNEIRSFDLARLRGMKNPTQTSQPQASQPAAKPKKEDTKNLTKWELIERSRKWANDEE